MGSLSDRLAALSPEKRELLRRRLMTADGEWIASRIPRAAKDVPLRPSFAQSRLWFDHQLDPESPAYNVARFIRLRGQLRIDLILECLQDVHSQHEVLRSNFRQENGELVQSIDGPQAAMGFRDLSHLSGDQQTDIIARFMSEEARRPFRLDSEPLLRQTLLKLNELEHIIVFVVHHIVFDGWSGRVYFGQALSEYERRLRDPEHRFPDIPLQYADYAYWQRDQLTSTALQTQLDYWRRQLAGMPDHLALPTDRVAPLTRSFRGAIHTFEIPQSLVDSLKELGRQHDATLYMTTLASFVAMLFRYSGQDDVVVGTPITTRTKPELEDLVGMFVNTLVLRTPVEGTLTFRQLLERVRKVTLEASENRDYPFEKLIEELHPERSGRRTPLVQVFFDLQRRQPLPALAGLEIDEVTHIDTETAMFDLSLALEETDRGLSAVLAYSTDLFEQSTVVRMTSHYLKLLEGMASDADCELRQLDLLDEVEREHVTVDWPGSVAAFPTGKCVHELFEEQACRTPDLIAVGCGTETLTYGELNRRSNQLARYLKGRGVGPEVLVGVCMERSIDWIVALSGILKAGGAHVSLDPTYPADRLAFMLSEASVTMLITTRALVAKVADSRSDILCLDEEWHRIAEVSDAGVEPSVTWDNAAYVVYTSGSSGRPKGVVNVHRGIFNLAWWHRTTFNISSDDRASQVARMGFDASVWEIWSYLTSGASLWIVDDDTRYSPPAVLAWLKEKRITMGWLPPALGEAVFQEPGIASLGMRLLFGGSDRAVQRPPDDAQFVYHNPYGPTEATVIVTHGRLAPASLDSGPIHVGRPIVNNQIYVLDDQLLPVPIGVAGQIYIGGAHLARGYLNDPTLTAARFIPHPFGLNGERLYATGDLGRFLSDGRIQVLGRIDDQVKIRGFRVELGEIEQTLVAHAAVREAIVIARDAFPSGKHLVAYVVPDLAEGESKQRLSALEAERIEQWRFLYEQTYKQTEADAFVGWNSSYSGAPIPADEMVEWRDATVARIMGFRPQRVLEIGCGTGLLLSVIAPEIESYSATDFSRTSLDQLRNRLADDARFERVNLLERMADDFTGLADNSFDVVILNSVVQYFPDLDYLLRVVDGAIRVVRDGGAVFIGDVRNFRLLDALHASIEVHKAQRASQLAEVRQRALRGASNEEELLIDPMFFPALSDRFAEISNVEIRLKRGLRHNELNRFRYDVTFRVGGSWRSAGEIPELDWKQDGLTLVALESFLEKDRPQELAIRDIPNARVAGEVRAADVLIHNGDSSTTLGELREIRDEAQRNAIDPEHACKLLEQLGYDPDLFWSRSGKEESFDLLLRIKNQLGEQVASAWHVNGAPLASYANNPLRPLIAEGLLPGIRSSLEEKLPEYMIPAAFVFLDSLPISSNGKVDRKSLPAPGPLKARADSRPPRTDVERSVAQIWADTLGISQSGRNGQNGQMPAIGIDDNLFELGGHSLMVAQIVSRLRDAFSVELPLRTVFDKPTIAEVAAEIEALRWGIEYVEAATTRAGVEIEEGEI